MAAACPVLGAAGPAWPNSAPAAGQFAAQPEACWRRGGRFPRPVPLRPQATRPRPGGGARASGRRRERLARGSEAREWRRFVLPGSGGGAVPGPRTCARRAGGAWRPGRREAGRRPGLESGQGRSGQAAPPLGPGAARRPGAGAAGSGDKRRGSARRPGRRGQVMWAPVLFQRKGAPRAAVTPSCPREAF